MKNRELITGPKAVAKEARRNEQLFRQRTFPWIFLLFFVLLGVCSWLIVKLFVQWKKNKRQTLRITPKEKALNELAKLNFSDIQRGQHKQFVTHLTQICRNYIEDQFHISHPSHTTEEFLNEVSQDRLLSSHHKDLLKHILRQTDQVKFANEKLDFEKIQKLNVLIKELIQN